MGKTKFDGQVDPVMLQRVRDGLKRDPHVVGNLMRRAHISVDKAIDKVLDLAASGVIALLLQPNGEVLIDCMDEGVTNDIIIDAEVQRILKGKPSRVEGATNRTPVEVK